ncbi:SDR family NAD(P)-dependent oxidoreductase [Actinoplanes subtropicus]|uniref:SDR family NAD(P)-dependent oxidoreductase n=1 Tax=Actinoplanes subtropicus TaxID=543632 RepID=UPI000AFA5B32|nr:SDR family NAD(P)-dependent oxidoreductase [Actinoplanes subtropicus]
MTEFAERYGPWAVVAGASQGIGEAFARALAGRGTNLVLVARRPEPLTALAEALPVRTVTVAADLATAAGLAAVFAATAELEVGLVVANAAYWPSGLFVDAAEGDLQRIIDLNCGAPVRLARHYLPPMAARRRGGLIVMSSASGLQGNPLLTAYAASKAFGAVLAEGLWWEMRGSGVDVTACVAGAVSTPGLTAGGRRPPPGTVAPDEVAAAALAGLGRGPRVVPGALMRVSTALMSRLMPRKSAIDLMARATKAALPSGDDKDGAA